MNNYLITEGAVVFRQGINCSFKKTGPKNIYLSVVAPAAVPGS